VECNIEAWIDLIRDVSFPTIIVELSKVEARFFVDHYQTLKDPFLQKDVSLSRCQLIRKDMNDLQKKIESSMIELGGEDFLLRHQADLLKMLLKLVID